MRKFYKNTLIYIRRTIYIGLYYLNFFLGYKNNMQPIILCYHSISNDSWRFSVSENNFKRQIKYLLKHREPLSLSQLNEIISDKKKITKPYFVINFDDGYKDILKVKNFLKKYNIKPTLFALSNEKNANREELETQRPFLTKKEILELNKYGWEIGCHTATHADLTTLTNEDLIKETINSKKDLEKKLGIKINYFSYPKGKYNQTILSTIKKAQFKLAVSMDDGLIDTEINIYKIPRIGVDGTHSFAEFKGLFLYPHILFRRVLKNAGFVF